MTIASYSLLAASIPCLWLSDRTRLIPTWLALLILSTITGWVGGLIDTPALVWVFLLGTGCFIFENRRYGKSTRALAGGLCAIVATALALHMLPGFNNVPLIESTRISPDGFPYTLYLNFDKALIGIFLLGFGAYLNVEKQRPAQSLRIYAGVTGLTASVLLPVSVLGGYVAFDPKLSPHLLSWAFSNLFITCLSEEAFFRGFIQLNLQRALRRHAHGHRTALLVAALLFGLAHFQGGTTYVVLASIAGIGYGLSYQLTGRIEAAMLTHFSVNLLHFLFFTYPALDALQ